MKLATLHFTQGGMAEIVFTENYFNESRTLQIDAIQDLVADCSKANDWMIKTGGDFKDYINTLPANSPNFVLQRKKMGYAVER